MKKNLTLLVLLFLTTLVVVAQDANIPTPQWRPLFHFTPLQNWTNDPNGLIYIDGVYHLYNQQNPFENKWGHMSWGHATSRDLVHWKHLPIAIPETIDKDTTWRFSGCAVLDKNNTSGFCKTKNCLVAIYTAHQPNLKKESQYVAYSNDGGLTFTNYDHNPVIDLNKHDFRDPNVFWSDKTRQWTMVVSLPAEHKVRFYGSADLKDWHLLSEFGPQGYTKANWECPFLIELPVAGAGTKTKWVLANSAAGRERGTYMQYFVGNFDGTTFTNDNPADTVLTLDYGDSFYAAIPWNNQPPGQKIYIGWMVPGATETSPWRGQMSIPRDLSLRQTSQGIRLVQRPASLIKSRLGTYSDHRVMTMKNVVVSDREMLLPKKAMVRGNCWWMQATLNVKTGAVAGFRIAQKKDSSGAVVEQTEIGYDAANNQVYVDRSRSGNAGIRPDKVRQTIGLTGRGAGPIQLEVILDKSSLEVFVNHGEAVLTTYIYPSEGADLISVFSSGGASEVESLETWNLSNTD